MAALDTRTRTHLRWAGLVAPRRRLSQEQRLNLDLADDIRAFIAAEILKKKE